MEDRIIVLDAEGKTDCEYSTDESLANEITEYLQKDIIMDFAGYEERSYSERFAREFLQRMSHDIRTPINGIRGMVDMADHYADDMEKQAEYRTKVKEVSNLLLELVNDVLDMSKLESGEIVLEEIPFNLSSIYREVLVVIEQMAAEQNIRIA